MQFSGVTKKETFSDFQVELDQQQIDRVSTFKYLGLWLDETLTFEEHIGQISKKVNKRLGILSKIRKNVNIDPALMLYKCLVLPHLEYCDVVWDNCASKFKDTLQKLQNRACKLILK